MHRGTLHFPVSTAEVIDSQFVVGAVLNDRVIVY
jgi:hypothetical protein